MKTRVGVVQLDPKLGCVDTNLATLERLIEQARNAGAQLVVAPEMATTGYLFMSREEALPFAETVPGPSVDRLAALCARLGVYLVVGILEKEPANGFLYNAAALIGPDGYIGKYRKTHPFLADTRWAVDGDLGFPVFDLPFGRLGVMVCMDVSYFETARLSAVAGAHLLAFPLNSRQPSPTEQWRVRASENGMYLLAANRTGFERGTRFSGGSSIVAPDGSILGTVAQDEGFCVADVDTDLCDRDLLGFGKPVGGRRTGAYYPLVLSPFRWSSAEVYGLTAEGSPGIVAVPARGTPDAVRKACEQAWYQFMQFHKVKPDVLVLPERALKARSHVEGVSGDTEEACGLHNPGSVRSTALDAGQALAFGAETAEALGSTLVFGFEEQTADGTWNSMMLVTPRGESHVYRQVHVAPGDAARVRAGSSFKVVDLPWGRVGFALGADLFYPETIRCLAQMGADVVLAGIERDPSPLAIALRERARSNHTHIVVAAWRGLSLFYLAEEQPGQELAAQEPGQVASRVLHISRTSAVRAKPLLQRRRAELYGPLC